MSWFSGLITFTLIGVPRIMNNYFRGSNVEEGLENTAVDKPLTRACIELNMILPVVLRGT